MLEFDRFVAQLGDHAKNFSDQELRQLHLEVHKLADILLAAHDEKQGKNRRAGFPQPRLDASGARSKIELPLTPHSDQGDIKCGTSP